MNRTIEENPNVTRKPVGFRIDFELVKMLKVLAIQQNKKVNVLLEEAIQDILRKYEGSKKEKID